MRLTCLLLPLALLLSATVALGQPSTINVYEHRVDLPAPTPPNPIVVDNAKQLFADDWVVEHSKRLSRTLHPIEKHPANPLLEPEEAWEIPSILLYGSVIYDPAREHDRFRMWYLCFTTKYSPDYRERLKKDGRVAYATSSDGIHWRRPKLGLYAYEGDRDTNIVITGTHGFRGVLFDPRDPDPKRRYKAHARTSHGHEAYFSADGIHWSEPVPLRIDGYDRSSVRWDPLRKLWIASTKNWYRLVPDGPERRGRGYQESADYLSWPDKAAFLAGTDADAPDIVYGLEPFFYESLFLGAWSRYTAEPSGLLDVQLAVSHNARHWERPSLEPWVPLTPLPEGYHPRVAKGATETGIDALDPRVPWDYGNNSINCAGVLRVDDELWVYYSGRSSDHRSRPQTGAIGLGKLRLDGFFSLDAKDDPGSLVTRPLRLVHPTLRVNADAGEGSIRVEVLDLDGEPIAPFTLDNCRALEADNLRHRVTWKGAADLSALQNRDVRLRFVLRDAELYAFWTGDERGWSTPDTLTWNSAKSQEP